MHSIENVALVAAGYATLQVHPIFMAHSAILTTDGNDLRHQSPPLRECNEMIANFVVAYLL